MLKLVDEWRQNPEGALFLREDMSGIIYGRYFAAELGFMMC